MFWGGVLLVGLVWVFGFVFVCWFAFMGVFCLFLGGGFVWFFGGLFLFGWFFWFLFLGFFVSIEAEMGSCLCWKWILEK